MAILVCSIFATMPAEDNSQGQYAGSISRLDDRPRLEEVNVTQSGPVSFEFEFDTVIILLVDPLR